MQQGKGKEKKKMAEIKVTFYQSGLESAILKLLSEYISSPLPVWKWGVL